jgi:hypothetical protein
MDLLARMFVSDWWRFWAEFDSVFGDLAAGDAEVVPLEAGDDGFISRRLDPASGLEEAGVLGGGRLDEVAIIGAHGSSMAHTPSTATGAPTRSFAVSRSSAEPGAATVESISLLARVLLQ